MLDRSLARGLLAAAMVLVGLGEAEAARQGGRPDRAKRAEMPVRECLARAMYFESNRTAEDGMLAVGTIVMNRLRSGRYGSDLCGVVAQYAQFAPGVLTRAMAEKKPAELARTVADAVLNGSRHPVAGDVMFFHTANVPFRNDDKHYVLVSGGNAFYKWNRGGDDEVEEANLKSLARAFEEADEAKEVGEKIVADAGEPRRFVAMVDLPDMPGETPVSAPLPRVEDATTAHPEMLARTLAYRSAADERSPQANAALVTVMTLGPRPARKPHEAAAPSEAKGPRVIEMSQPVLASSAPTFASRHAPTPEPLANRIVAAAWSLFQ